MGLVYRLLCSVQGFSGDTSSKNSCANAGDVTDAAQISESGRSPGGRNDNPLSSLAWRTPWIDQEPGRLQSIELQGVGHGSSNLACMHVPCGSITQACIVSPGPFDPTGPGSFYGTFQRHRPGDSGHLYSGQNRSIALVKSQDVLLTGKVMSVCFKCPENAVVSACIPTLPLRWNLEFTHKFALNQKCF